MVIVREVGEGSIGRGGVRSGASVLCGEKSVWMEMICCSTLSTIPGERDRRHTAFLRPYTVT